MISEKIKILLLLLIVGVFGFFAYFALTKYEIKENEQKIQKEVAEINILEPHSPVNNIGEYIYTDWSKPKTLPKTVIPHLPNNLQVVDKIISWGHYTPKQSRTIDTIIIHSTYNAIGGDVHDLEKVIEQLRMYRVTYHYLITREGDIYRLAPGKAIAYHAGVSRMPEGSRVNIINNFSIGIGLLYHKNETPNKIQYQKLVNLVKNLKLKYKIDYILGHKDIAPSRKTDPWNFDWQKFNEMLKK